MPALLESSGVVVSEALITAFQNSLQGIATQYQSMIEIALPIGLGMFAVAYAIRAGIGFFKSVSH